jgi:hypothetical protein
MQSSALDDGDVRFTLDVETAGGDVVSQLVV